MGKVFTMTTQVSKDLWDNPEAREFAWRAVRDQCAEKGRAEGYRPAEIGRDYDNAPLGQPFECQWSNPLRGTWEDGEPTLVPCYLSEATVIDLTVELYCVRGETPQVVNP